LRKENDIVHRYVSFIHRNFPKEEENHYLVVDWKSVAEAIALETGGLAREEVIAAVRRHPDYMERLRKLK
jgi:hypothetical protein